MKRTLCLVLVLFMLLPAAACSKLGGDGEGEPQAAEPVKLTGAASAEELLQKVEDYINHDHDFRYIDDVFDFELMNADIMYHNWGIMEWQQCVDAAHAMTEGAEAYAKSIDDPEGFLESMYAVKIADPHEYVSDYLEELANAFKEGTITEDSPDYEKLRGILVDRDKGVDYVIEHHPEILEEAHDTYGRYKTVFSLQDALDYALGMRSTIPEGLADEYRLFIPLNAEFHPEEVNIDEDTGVCEFDIAQVMTSKYDRTTLYMSYAVRNERYYLVQIGISLGGVGG